MDTKEVTWDPAKWSSLVGVIKTQFIPILKSINEACTLMKSSKKRSLGAKAKAFIQGGTHQKDARALEEKLNDSLQKMTSILRYLKKTEEIKEILNISDEFNSHFDVFIKNYHLKK
jgi:5-bromo-4-chloroindolyl phosphate hydrolysis protein